MIAPEEWPGPSPVAQPNVAALPTLVMEARRARGLGVEELARLADVSARDVSAIETGDVVSAASRDAIRSALGLTDAVGHVRTRPASPSHAQAMLRVHEVALAKGGLVASPDVLAWRRFLNHDPDARTGLEVARRDADSSSDGALALSAVIFVPGGLVMVALVLTGVLGGGWAFAGALAWFGTLGLMVRKTVRAFGRYNLANRVLAAHEAMTATCDAMSTTGFVVSPEGLWTVDVRRPEPRLAEHPARSVYSVEVLPQGDAHVTVVVGCTGGVVHMEWLPRSQALLDVVSAWAEPSSDLPWATTRSVT